MLMRRLPWLALLPLPACTTLGPMPAATGASVAPERAGVEVQGALAPGYFLSDTAKEEAHGSVIQQLSGFVEPGDTIGIPGLAFGGRYVGGADDSPYFEPMVRYRMRLAEPIAMGVVGYGTHAKGSAAHASYSMTRGGLEASTDLRVTPKSRWAEIHFLAGGGLTGLSARGAYCQGDHGYAASCDERLADTTARLRGAYPTGFFGVGLDIAKHHDSILHGLRALVMGAGGTMPHVHWAEQAAARTWFSWGVALGVGMGAAE